MVNEKAINHGGYMENILTQYIEVTPDVVGGKPRIIKMLIPF